MSISITSSCIAMSLVHNLVFFFNDTATTEIYTLSLHDALPISDGANGKCACRALDRELPSRMPRLDADRQQAPPPGCCRRVLPALQQRAPASEPQATTASFPRPSYSNGRGPSRAYDTPRRLAQ